MLAKSKSGNGRSVLSIQIGFIRFVARIGRHAILFGCERMHDACFKSSPGGSPFGRQLIIVGSFHDDDEILDVVLLPGLAKQFHCQLKEARLMLYRSGFNEQIPKVVGHHPLGPMLGWIDTHDGKPLTTNLLDAVSDDAIGFLQILSLA